MWPQPPIDYPYAGRAELFSSFLPAFCFRLRLTVRMHQILAQTEGKHKRSWICKSHAFRAICALGCSLNVSAEELPAVPATAQPANVDKSGYTLFNRTPSSALREMSTD